MTTPLLLLVLLVGAANARAEERLDSAARTQAVDFTGRPAFAGYRAEVEVSSGGVTRHGLIIVTREGCVHLEHLDEPTVRRVHGAIRPQSPSRLGWDDRPLRAGPVRIVWGRLGQTEVLAEIHTPEASIRVSRHKLLSAR